MKTFYILFLTLFSQLAAAQTEFITRWNLATSGSADTELSFGVIGTGTVDYTWAEVSPGTASGSGSFTASASVSLATITGLPDDALIELKITPTDFSQIIIDGGTDKDRLIDVSQWGTTAWKTMSFAFKGCSNLQISAPDLPNLSMVTAMYEMFSGCTALNGPANIGSWETASVTNMSLMFLGATAFNQPIGSWDTGQVTSMDNMFVNATAFNQPIGNWATGNVNDMGSMFYHAVAFNQPIGNWNTAQVTIMYAMFNGASAFNQPIATQPGGIWNTGNVTNMGAMFNGATAFNAPVGNWDTGKVTDMSGMFANATAFNQPIDMWNTANVTNMGGMFYQAVAFNQPIGNWATGNVNNMGSMFSQAVAFNQPIGNWNTAQVTNMNTMFNGASAFNQPIATQPGGIWNTGNVINMGAMFSGAAAFNAPIGNWDTGKVTDMSGMFANATAFNQPIDIWNTANVTNMGGMFYQAIAFNQPIGNWNTVNVASMFSMFNGASAFNQPVATQAGGIWNTANVTDMSYMFYQASAFNQPVGSWNTANVSNLSDMFSNATSFNQSIGTWTFNATANLLNILNTTAQSCYNYSATLIGWSANPLTPNSLSLGFIDRAYGTNAVAARSDLITVKGWQFNGDVASGLDCSDPLPVTLISFSGKKTAENQNLLKWITSDEKNFDRFEVQRSSDAKAFESIGVVYGQMGAHPDRTPSDEPNSGQMLNAYTFTDIAPAAANYYRLKMVDRAANDLDGSFQYSRIISIENSVEQAVVGSFYPNPSNAKVFVDVYALESGNWTLTVTDVGGKAIFTQVHGLQKGMNKISLNPLSAGIKLVRFESGVFSEVRKLVRE